MSMIPVMVSIGPYHHGKPEVSHAEEFKHVCLDWYAGGDQEKKSLFYNKILENIHDIRDCYAEVSIVKKYDNKSLALMMLLDACFIINFMHNSTGNKGGNFWDWIDCFGTASSIRFTSRDIMVLENQIPLQVIKLMMSLQYHEDEVEDLLVRFISFLMKMDLKQVKMAQQKYIYNEHPFHILEACWRVLGVRPNQKLHNSKSCFPRRSKKDAPYRCRSVMDLKAKGIHFRTSSSCYLRDITFKSFSLYGLLRLPVLNVSDHTSIMLSNMIAYEVSPTSRVSPVVLSYTIFMKALIESPEDVKHVQEHGIIWNSFANHEQVVKVFKDIETFGFTDVGIIRHVRERIDDHCGNKAEIWMVDLFRTKLRTPCTVIALLAAIFLLCLTFLQTYFTIHPVK